PRKGKKALRRCQVYPFPECHESVLMRILVICRFLLKRSIGRLKLIGCKFNLGRCVISRLGPLGSDCRSEIIGILYSLSHICETPLLAGILQKTSMVEYCLINGVFDPRRY